MTPLIWIYEAVNLTSHLYKEQYVLMTVYNAAKHGLLIVRDFYF